MIKQSACESVSHYHARYMFSLAEEAGSEASTADTETYTPNIRWSVASGESIPDDVQAFVRGLRCPRCREFVVLRRPQTIEGALHAASQFEVCYSGLPAKKLRDETAMSIMLSRMESDPQAISSPSTDIDPLPEEESSVVADVGGGCKDESRCSSTVYFNSLLGRLEAAGVSKKVLADYRELFRDLHRNQFKEVEAGVREQHARDHLEKHRKYQYDYEKHQYHPYETHMTIKLAACTRFWRVGIKIPIMAIQIRKPTWMRRLFHKLPLALSSPGLSYNT